MDDIDYRRRALLAGLAAAVGLAGCSGDSDSSERNDTSRATTNDAAPTDPPGRAAETVGTGTPFGTAAGPTTHPGAAANPGASVPTATETTPTRDSTATADRRETPVRRTPPAEPTDGEPTKRTPTRRPETDAPASGDRSFASREGNVVAVGRSIDGDVIIDPAETETPVGDAVRAIDETGGRRGFGAVFLPPGTITEAEPLVPSQFTRILGWGINTSVIRFTDLSRDGIRVTELKDGKFVTLDGFTLVGSEPSTERRTGSAVHFDNQTVNPKHFDIGSLGFRNWADPVVHLERGAPFGCVWQHLDFGFDANDGTEIAIGRNQSFLGSQIGFISAGNRTGDPVVTTDYSGARFTIGFLNVGGSAGRALDLQTTWNGHVTVGGINYETGRDLAGPVVSLDGPASTRLEYVKNTDAAVDSVLRLGRRNAHNVVGRVRNVATVRRGKIEITDQPVGPSYYFGPSSDFVTDLSDLDHGVWALGDMRTADGRDVGAGPVRPRTYSDPDPADIAVGEFAVALDDADGPALVYRDESGSLHYWRTS